MSHSSAHFDTPPATPPPPPPATQIPCRHCGGICIRTRQKRLGVVLHSFGSLLMLLGYLALVAKGLFLITWQIRAVWQWRQTGAYVVPDQLTVDAAWFGAIASSIVLGHLLALVRPAWMCTACGSLFDRSEQPEMLHAEQMAKQRAE